ncbi:MAG: hypothetical protein DI539_25555 [Flavobacterium psychrophilum]|nr:MAG: hypothetical protein DI539_25555 [Flavobacterium psychrophilum]
MTLITLPGDSWEIGKVHGSLLKEPIHAFITQLHHACKPVAQIEETLEKYRQIIQHQLPDIYTEILGLAEGAAISIQEAILLQVRREIVGVRRYTLTGDCTTIGFLSGDDSTIAQTIDLEGGIRDYGYAFKIQQENKPTLLQ